MSKAESLVQILDSSDLDACRDFFRNMSESGRRELYPAAAANLKKQKKNSLIETKPGHFEWNPLLRPAQYAHFATATWSEIDKAGLRWIPDHDDVMQILRDRRPDWIDAFVQGLLQQQYFWGSWWLIRRLVREKMAHRPEVPNYYIGMIGALGNRFDETSLTETLLANPDLLKDDIWRLFEYEGGGEISLANMDRFGHGRSFAHSFVELMQAGKLPRKRLLESALEALERDFNHYKAKWFFEFYDLLQPTDRELRSHAPRLLSLLQVSAPNVVTWAFERVQHLADAGCYAAEELAEGIKPLMLSRNKGRVHKALRLLNDRVSEFPESGLEMARTAAMALAHEKPDVQNAALDIIELHAADDAETRDIIRKSTKTLAASVRKRVEKLIGGSPDASAASGAPPERLGKRTRGSDNAAVELPAELRRLFCLDTLKDHGANAEIRIPAVVFEGTELPRLPCVSAVQPIRSAEELIDVSARVVEDGSQVTDAERCIDGLARLCGELPDNFETLAAPLLKRVRQLLKKGASPFCGMDPANDLLGLFYALCTGTAITPVRRKRDLVYDFEGEEHGFYAVNCEKPIGFLSRRCQDIATRVALRKPQQLLSTPTHEQGWIDPVVLADRVQLRGTDVPARTDVVLALLRMAPENRSQALQKLSTGKSEWQQAVRYAMGASKVAIGDTAALWIAAARARNPWCVDQAVLNAFPKSGPDAAEPAEYRLSFRRRKSGSYTFTDVFINTVPELPKTSDPSNVTVAFHAARSIGRDYTFEAGGFAGRTAGAVRWTATIWPLARESFFAGAVLNCLDNIDWSEAQWQNRTMLEPLLDPGTPLRSMGLRLLIGMLSAKEPGESGLATDIAIRAIEDGRLGTDNLAMAMSELLPSGLIKPGRWQKALGVVAGASAVHAAVVQRALQDSLSADTSEWPKDTGKLLELLLELTAEHQLPLTAAFQKILCETKFSGALRRQAAAILAASSESAAASVLTIQEAALTQRRKAASRFSTK